MKFAMLDPRESASGPGLYGAYAEWKGRAAPFRITPEQQAYFAGECRGVKIAYADVFEVGFGSGSFLAWARQAGARVAGCEIDPIAVAAASDFGVELLPPDFETVAGAHEQRFDTIVAFDVFEHLTLDEITRRLAAAEIMLRPGGHLMLRFPNAQSPFGLVPQNGDPTHKTALSRTVFELLIQRSAFAVERYGPSFRIGGGGLARMLVRPLRHLGRDVISAVLNAIYATDIPWDPVVVLILRKETGAVSDRRWTRRSRPGAHRTSG